MEDLNLLLNCVKYLGYALILWFCTTTLSACGVKAGDSFVMGTTSYLEEANRVQLQRNREGKRNGYIK